MNRKANLNRSLPDDAALLWWYGMSEEERFRLELTCLEMGVPLSCYVFLQSGQGVRLNENLKREAERTAAAVGELHDALIDLGLWGLDDDEPHAS